MKLQFTITDYSFNNESYDIGSLAFECGKKKLQKFLSTSNTVEINTQQNTGYGFQ